MIEVLLLSPEILKNEKSFTDLLRDAKAALEFLVQKHVPPLWTLEKGFSEPQDEVMILLFCTATWNGVFSSEQHSSLGTVDAESSVN